MAVYADDGSIRVTVVDGSTFTGAQAPDGSLYVVVRTSQIGRYHPCGALLVTPVITNAAAGALAPDGSLFVSESPYFQTSQKVTVVSGSLRGGGGSSSANFSIAANSMYVPLLFGGI